MARRKNEFPALKTKYEFIVFLEFLEKTTGWEKGALPDSFHSKNGIEGIYDGEIDIYFESYGDCRWGHEKTSKTKRAFISLRDSRVDPIRIFEEPDYSTEIVLGPEFIKSLVLKRPLYWWLFVATCSENCRIVSDKGGKLLTLTARKLPCIYPLIGIVPSLETSEIDNLSVAFEEEYIYRRRRSKHNYVILGNGISIPFGSDSWNQMSDYLFDYLKPQYIDNSSLVKTSIGGTTFSTTSIAKTIINPDKFYEAIHSCIYRKYEESMHISNTLLREIALSKKNK